MDGEKELKFRRYETTTQIQELVKDTLQHSILNIHGRALDLAGSN